MQLEVAKQIDIRHEGDYSLRVRKTRRVPPAMFGSFNKCFSLASKIQKNSGPGQFVVDEAAHASLHRECRRSAGCIDHKPCIAFVSTKLQAPCLVDFARIEDWCVGVNLNTRTPCTIK